MLLFQLEIRVNFINCCKSRLKNIKNILQYLSFDNSNQLLNSYFNKKLINSKDVSLGL